MPEYPIEEHQIASVDDTQPIKVAVKHGSRDGLHRVVGFICLVAAAVLTAATAIIVLTPTPAPVIPTAPPLVASSLSVTIAPTTERPAIVDPQPGLPTLSADQAQTLLSTPVTGTISDTIQIVRDVYNPFTIIPDRPRSEVVEYEVVTGDTINTIAERFNLQPETIAWSNPRSIIQILRPGDRIKILPVDGVYYMALGSKTIGEIAADYSVNAFAILDSEFNTLQDLNADSIPPSGTSLVIPGGTAEQISWNPPVVRVNESSGGGTSSSSSGSQISFAAGDPGSCGLVNNPGGGAAWSRPINNYTWIRGFASWHPAVDLAAPLGTPIYAANGGRVIFAGWSNWGYGNAIVVAHGPFTTLYAHLSSINVSCGQDVSSGQQIGGSGNSGNSSGPHVHFEIRYQDVPQDPTFTIAFQ